MVKGVTIEEVNERGCQVDASREMMAEEPVKRTSWFQTTVETKQGTLLISIFQLSLGSEGFEIEISRGKAFEVKTFICSTVEQVWELHTLLIRDAELYFGVLVRTGWVDEAGRRYPFKVGDHLVCEGGKLFKLSRPLKTGEVVLLLDSKGEIVNQCSAQMIYRSLYGEAEERYVATRHDLKTDELIYTRVMKLKPNELTSC